MGKDLKGKELGSGICQRKDRRYYARYVNKQKKRVEKYFTKSKEAKRWLEDEKYKDRHSDIRYCNDIIFDTWVQHWVNYKKMVIRESTLKNYICKYNKVIKPQIGDMLLKDIKSLHCQEILNSMANKGYCNNTIMQARIIMHNIFQYAVDNEILEKNPCNHAVKCNVGKTSKKKEALTLENQKKFLTYAISQPYYIPYAFILQTGLRISELNGLEWSDVDFKNKNIRIQRTKNQDKGWKTQLPKTKSSIRTIPLTDEAVNLLKEQKRLNKSIKVTDMKFYNSVFLNNGTLSSCSSYNKRLYKICEMADIPKISVHILRHTFATRCAEGGMKPKTLQKILGHTNINVTMNIYVHMTENEKIKEMESIQEYLKIS